MVKKAALATPNHLLRTAREEKGLTQGEVADRIRAPHALNISRWESGTTFPRAYYVTRLCLLFEKSPKELGLLRSGNTVQRSPFPLNRIHESTAFSSATLPVQVTPLIGREREIDEVATLLQRSEIRLLTLIGTGGVGKTRLGLQVAQVLAAHFLDGVFFVNLAPLSDSALVIPTIAHALGLKESSGQSMFDVLKIFLGKKHLLLLLDNFEHVLSAHSQITELLALCRCFKVLVTSRVVLNLRGEQLFPVQPLAVPDLECLPDIETLSQYEAITLFVQRAQAIQCSFALTSENAFVITEICRRLNGVPLAIELAARRISLLSLQQLLAGLEQQLQVLIDGPNDVPERQRTMYSTIQWSYTLLSVSEQWLFRMLSVFVAGFTIEAPSAFYDSRGKDEESVLAILLGALINSSLLLRAEITPGETRLNMLEPLREYGLNLLKKQHELPMAQKMHAHYYLSLAQAAKPTYFGAPDSLWLDHLARDHENLRAAMQWFLAQGDAGQSMEPALRLGVALLWLWQNHGHWSEGQHFMERALRGGGSIPSVLKANALQVTAWMIDNQGNFMQAQALYEESLVLFREAGDTAGIAFSLFALGRLAFALGELREGCSLMEEAKALWQTLGEKAAIAHTCGWLANIASYQGAYTRAYELFGESRVLHGEIENNMLSISDALYGQAFVLFLSQGEPGTIQALLAEGLAIAKEGGGKETIADIICLQGWVALSQGDILTARSRLKESEIRYKEMNEQEDMARVSSLLGRLAVAEHDYATAYTRYQEALALALKGNYRKDLSFYLEEFASVVATQGELVWAAQLWGAADALREATGIIVPPVDRAHYEHARSITQRQVKKETFVAGWTEGHKMTPEQVLAVQHSIIRVEPQPALMPMPVKFSISSSVELTARQLEILRLVAQGFTNGQMADELRISPHTVRTHVNALYSKLAVTSRSAATRYAIEHHLA